ncbi:MAG TPA: hypothetical protein VFP49_10340 [Nitrososphaeraceae archaeon]|nr:hypothetical protein [Nitrososphaeraceae archaeon]
MTNLNSNLTTILYIIGKSETPLTSRQIENYSQLSKYVYDKLEYLIPNESDAGKKFVTTKLFDLEDLINNKMDMKKKVHDKINEVFYLSWKIEKEDLEYNMNVKLITDGHFQNLKILYGKDKSIMLNGFKFHIPEEFLTLEILSGTKHYSYPILMKRNQKKKITFYKVNYIYRNNYLDVEYDLETQRRINLIKNSSDRYFGTKEHEGETVSWKSLEKQHRIYRLKSNRSKWRYSLNIIGFLQYLYLENNINRKDKKNELKK